MEVLGKGFKMNFSIMTTLTTILFQNITWKLGWISIYILMPFSHGTNLGKILFTYFKVNWCKHPGEC